MYSRNRGQRCVAFSIESSSSAFWIRLLVCQSRGANTFWTNDWRGIQKRFICRTHSIVQAYCCVLWPFNKFTHTQLSYFFSFFLSVALQSGSRNPFPARPSGCRAWFQICCHSFPKDNVSIFQCIAWYRFQWYLFLCLVCMIFLLEYFLNFKAVSIFVKFASGIRVCIVWVPLSERRSRIGSFEATMLVTERWMLDVLTDANRTLHLLALYIWYFDLILCSTLLLKLLIKK